MIRISSIAFTFVSIGMILASGALAQSGLPDRYAKIPADSIVVGSVDVARILGMKEMEYWPLEILHVACEEQLGINSESIESVDLTIGLPSTMPEFGVSIRSSKPVDIATLNERVATPIEEDRKNPKLRFRDLRDNPMVRIAQAEPNTVLIGTQGTLRRMLSERTKSGGAFVDLVRKSSHPIRLAVNVASLRDLAQGFYSQSEENIPPALREDIEAVIDLTENVLVETTPIASNALRLTIGAASAEAANKLNGALLRLRQEGLRLVNESIEAEMAKENSMSEKMKAAVEAYKIRLNKKLVSEEFWVVRENRIELETALLANYPTIGILTGLLLPAVQAAREAARRMSSSNNMRQLMLGLLNYESAYRRFPGRAICDADGTPLLSWRVAILPFIEENQLYQEFHLDEPWDSPHNIELLERMPQVFANPRAIVPPNHTVYLAPFGEETGWSIEPFRIGSIMDGTSGTIGLVEASDSYAVPWTKPDDLDVDANANADWLRMPGSNIVLFDGSVRFLSAGIDWEMLQALISHDGGEPINIPDMEP